MALNRESMLTAVQTNIMNLLDLPEELRADKDIVLAAVAHNGAALRYAEESLRGDRDVVLQALRQEGRALRYASKELQSDRELVLAAVTQRGDAIRHASEYLRADKEVAFAAVKQNGLALGYTAEELRGDRELVLAAVQQDSAALWYADASLRRDTFVSMSAGNDEHVVLPGVGATGNRHELHLSGTFICTPPVGDMSDPAPEQQESEEESNQDSPEQCAAGLANQHDAVRRDLKVHFEADSAGPEKTHRVNSCNSRCLSCSRAMDFLLPHWQQYGHPLSIIAQTFEIWSMGIWLAFLSNDSLSRSLNVICNIDLVCNCVYLIDSVFTIIAEAKRVNVQAAMKDSIANEEAAAQDEPSEDETVHHAPLQATLNPAARAAKAYDTCRKQAYKHHRIMMQIAVAISLFPVQVALRDMLHKHQFPVEEVLVVIIFRLIRVCWAVSDCINFINRTEMQVYVNIRIRGTSASSWNKARILFKQFCVVLFCGHMIGCIAYAYHRLISKWSKSHADYISLFPGGARTYFDKFGDEALVPWDDQQDFFKTYVLCVYKGFNCNLEDLLPETTAGVVLEVVGSMLIVLMKSYCIGSFFKYHQKREFEVQRFQRLMATVATYCELYQLPPSLQKAVIAHFTFQHDKQLELKTLDVLSMLPNEVKKKLREHEFLPIVRGRNPIIFAKISHETCMRIVVMLQPCFLMPGEIIFLEGEAPRELVFLENGTVSISRNVSTEGTKHDQLVKYLRADRNEDPTILGEVSVILGRPHFYSARARAGTESSVLRCARQHFDELCGTYPGQYEQLVCNVAEELGLDAQGKLLQNKEQTAEHDTEYFKALQQEVVTILTERQEALQASFLFAAGSGHNKKVKELLAKHSDPNVTDYDLRSALHVAAGEGHIDVIEVLLEASCNVNGKDRWGRTPMQDAIFGGFLGAAKVLAKSHGVLNLAHPSQALCKCAVDGDVLKMQQLLDFGVGVNEGGYDKRTALHVAAAQGHLTVLTFLIDSAADVNAKDRWDTTPLKGALMQGHSTVARYLFRCHSKLDAAFAANQLCDSASSGDLRMLQTLHQCGVDVDQGDYDRRTALHLAAAEGQILALNYLLGAARAHHSPLDRWQATPLQDALAGKYEVCIQLLLAAGGELGPFADKALQEEVRKRKKQFFGERGEYYVSSIFDLRKLVTRHTDLVYQGRARPDMFDPQQVSLFNRQLLNREVVGLRKLSSDVYCLASLLSRLASALEIVPGLLQLIEDSISCHKESRIWQGIHDASKKRQGKSKKDAHLHMFDTVFLHGMKVAPKLTQAMQLTTAQVLRRVEAVCRSRHWCGGAPESVFSKGRGTASLDAGSSGKYAGSGIPTLTHLVMQELLKALGWRSKKSPLDNLDGIHGPRRGKDAELMRLVAKMEEVACAVLPIEHLSLHVLRKHMTERVSGETAIQECIVDIHGSCEGAVFAELRSWLKKYAAARLSKKGASTNTLPSTPVGISATAPYEAIRPTHTACETKSLPLIDPQAAELASQEPPKDVAAQSFSHHCEQIRRQLIASELVLLATTAIVMDAWASVEKSRLARDSAHEAVFKKPNHILGFESSDRKAPQSVTREEINDLTHVFLETADSCRGVDKPQWQNKKALMKTTEQDAGKAMGHVLPIQCARILSLQHHMSLEELEIMHDFSDAAETNSLFGSMTDGRFVLNLLRWILSHDERQQELLAEAHTGQMDACRSSVLAVKPNQMAAHEGNADAESNSDYSETESELLAEIQHLQDQFSQDSENSKGSKFDGAQRVSMVEEEPATIGVGQGQGQKGSAIPMKFLDKQLRHNGDQQPTDSEATNWFGWLLHKVRSIYENICGHEGKARRMRKRVAKRFREIDEDGEGVGVMEIQHLLGIAFQHTLGQDMEQRFAYRVFELLERDEVGALVLLPELLQVLQAISDEVRDLRRKKRMRGAEDDSNQAWQITQMLSVFVVSPDARFLYWWDLTRHYIALYYLLEVPIRFCFLSIDKDHEWEIVMLTYMNGLSDIFMILNVLLSFFRGFNHPTRGIVINFHDIRVHYLMNWFFFDVIASTPLDVLATDPGTVHSTANHTGHGTMQHLASTFVHRRIPTLRLLKLLHVRHLLSRSQRLENKKQQTQSFAFAAWGIVCYILILIHVLACTWWYVGTTGKDFNPRWGATLRFSNQTTLHQQKTQRQLSWTYSYETRQNEPPLGEASGLVPFWWQYLVSFYWTAGQITGQSSTGNMVASNFTELAWVCMLFFFNVAVNGYCDGVLVDKVIAGDDSIIEAKAMRRMVEDFLSAVDLPRELVDQIKVSAEAFSSMHQRTQIEELADEIPHALRQRIAKRLFVHHFSSSPFFGPCCENFLTELAIHCRLEIVRKGSQLVQVGEPVSKMYILTKGQIALLDNSGKVLAEYGGVSFMIGDVALIFNLKYSMSVSTIEECSMLSVDVKSFAKTCELYPEDALLLRQTAVQVMEDICGTDFFEEQARVPAADSGDAKSRVSQVPSGVGKQPSVRSEQSIETAIQRVYGTDLQFVADGYQAEEAEAKRRRICRVIQHAANGDLEKVQTALAKGDFHMDDSDGGQRTVLHLAACNNHLGLVKFLVLEGASLNVKDTLENTPLDDAIREQRAEVAMFLKSARGNYQVTTDVASKMCDAAYRNDVDNLRLFTEILEIIPNASDHDKRTALHLAASEGNLESLEFLLSHPAIDPSPRDRLGNTPLDDSMRHKHHEARVLLQKAGAQLGNPSLGVTLCALAHKNDWETLREMAECNVKMDEGDYDHRTALHLAASEGNLETATYLIKVAKCNVNSLDRFEQTPYDDAVRHEQGSVLALLEEHRGCSGSDTRMKEYRRHFHELLKEQRAANESTKLEREMTNTEVSLTALFLKRLFEDTSLEDDVHSFITHLVNFQSLLLRLLRSSLEDAEDGVPEPEQQDDEEMGEGEPVNHRDPPSHTRKFRERLLEQASSGLEASGGRVLAILEADVLPWFNNMSKGDGKLLKLLAPGLRDALYHAQDTIKLRSDLTRIVKKLHHDEGKTGKHVHSSPPLGLISLRIAAARMDVVHEARLQASMMVWAAREPASNAADNSANLEKRQPRPLMSNALHSLCASEFTLPRGGSLPNFPGIARLAS